MNHLALILAFCAALLPIAGACLIVQLQRSEADKVGRRLGMIVESFGSSGNKLQASNLRMVRPRGATMIKAQRVYGFDRHRRAHAAAPFPRVFVAATTIAMVGAFVATRLVGPSGWAAALPLSILFCRLFYRRCDERYSAGLFRQFPDALGMIVRAVRVGVGVGNAVVLVAEESQAPTSFEFRQLSEEIAIGRPLPDALRAMGARNRLPEYRFFATALSLQSQTGGGLAETLETLADTIRKRVAIKMRGHALAAEARLSCYVLGGLPFVVGGFIFVSNPSYISVLFTTSAGEKLLGLALVMLALGITVMQTMTKNALR